MDNDVALSWETIHFPSPFPPVTFRPGAKPYPYIASSKDHIPSSKDHIPVRFKGPKSI